jgi:periplasmic divalent cation tolerance protein
MDQTLLVITNCPDEASANAIALAVVEARLAACVNLLPRIQSIYRWQGSVESATEIPLFIKSTAAHYPTLEQAIRERHPHRVPEIIALPVAHGLPDYLNWVAAETLQQP